MTTDENIQKLWLACQIACLLKFINKFDEEKTAKLSEKETQFFEQCCDQLQLLASSLHPDLFQTDSHNKSAAISQIATLESISRGHLSSITPRRSSLAPKPLRHKNLVENYKKHVAKNHDLINESIDIAYSLAWDDYVTDTYYDYNEDQELAFSRIASAHLKQRGIPNPKCHLIKKLFLQKISDNDSSTLELIRSSKLGFGNGHVINYSRIDRLFSHFRYHYAETLSDCHDTLMSGFDSKQVDASLYSLQLLNQKNTSTSVSSQLLEPAAQWQQSLRAAVAKRPKIKPKKPSTPTTGTLKTNSENKARSSKSHQESDLLDYQPRSLTFLKPLANLVKQETVRLNSCWLLFSCFTGKRAKARDIETAYNDVCTAARNNKVNSLKEAFHFQNSSLAKAFAHRRHIDKKAPTSWNNLMSMFNSSHHSFLKYDKQLKDIQKRFS